MDYDLEKINVEWSGPLTTVSPKINTTSKKINVEWSGPLTFVSPKIIMTSSINKCRVVWPSHHSFGQNNYDLQKIIMRKTFIKIKLLPPLKIYETMKNDENEQ